MLAKHMGWFVQKMSSQSVTQSDRKQGGLKWEGLKSRLFHCSACQIVCKGAVHFLKYNHNNPVSTFMFCTSVSIGFGIGYKYLHFHNNSNRKHDHGTSPNFWQFDKKTFSADLTVYENWEVNMGWIYAQTDSVYVLFEITLYFMFVLA